MPRIKLLAFILILLSALTMTAQSSQINIWQDTPVKSEVIMKPYLAPGSDNRAVIVCPGGSYFWLARKTEGDGVARWLQSQGISAFVLEYRVGGIDGFLYHYRLWARGNRYPDMLLDVQRAIQLVREGAQEYGIDPDQLGVMGFSAGGHLAVMSALKFDNDMLATVGVENHTDLKPNFIAPIYPVVTMVEDCCHKRSRRGLLGDDCQSDARLREELSLERNIRPDMPPTYLMNCVDDPIVNYHNSELLDSALTAKGVPHHYIQFKTGGHGFGANPKKTTSEAIAWKEDFLNWLNNLK